MVLTFYHSETGDVYQEVNLPTAPPPAVHILDPRNRRHMLCGMHYTVVPEAPPSHHKFVRLSVYWRSRDTGWCSVCVDAIDPLERLAHMEL